MTFDFPEGSVYSDPLDPQQISVQRQGYWTRTLWLSEPLTEAGARRLIDDTAALTPCPGWEEGSFLLLGD